MPFPGEASTLTFSVAKLVQAVFCKYQVPYSSDFFKNFFKKMKKIENNFAVTGFVGKDAEIRQFTTASVARFSLAIGRSEKNGEENNRVSAFINVEAWRKNENADSFDKLTKGSMLTVEGYFKPEEWSDQEGVKHNRVLLVATKFYETPDKEEAPKEEEKKSKKKAK